MQKSATPAGSGVLQPWPSSMPHGCTMITAVLSARSRLGISMIPRALYENRQARTDRSAPSSFDQHRRLESPQLAHRLDELGIVGQQRRRVLRAASGGSHRSAPALSGRPEEPSATTRSKLSNRRAKSDSLQRKAKAENAKC